MARYRVGLETRERILAATRQLLSEGGVEAVTLKAITSLADVGVGSFYNLFDSKEAAVFEVIREALDAVDPDPAGAGTDSLQDLVEAFIVFMTNPSAIARIYLQLATLGLTDPTLAARVLRSHRRRVLRFTEAWLRHDPSIGRDEATERAQTLMASLTGLGLTSLIDPSFDMRLHAERLLPAGTVQGR